MEVNNFFCIFVEIANTMATLNFEDFKSMVSTNNEFKNNIIGKNDVIDWDNGTMMIYKENIGKYLEKYACKDATDLADTLWYAYGMYVKIV